MHRDLGSAPRKGHPVPFNRSRVAIAGHEKNGNFERIPASGGPVIIGERNEAFPSMIELPVMKPNQTPTILEEIPQ